MDWVFGYGSLVWDPGFPYIERSWGLLHGYHRAGCRYSYINRGTPECPGLMLALAAGGSCHGVAYAIQPGREAEAHAYLNQREGPGYLRKQLPVEFPKGHSPRFVEAWTYVANPDHESYFSGLSCQHMAELVAQGLGKSGESYAYMKTLLEHLGREGRAEPELEAILNLATALRQNGLQPGSPRYKVPPAQQDAPARR